MKLQLTDSEFNNLIRVYRINVVVDLVKISDIAADIRPLYDENGNEDTLAIEEYTDFIINALGVFDSHDFEILDEHTSNKSDSYYYTLVKKDQVENMRYKYILFVRLSDHANRKESESAKKTYYAHRADELKQPATKSKQTWRLKEVTVNKDTFNSYDEALDYIDNILP